MNPEPVPEPALGDVARRYPGWHCWQGVSGPCYASLPGSSPPVVVRGKDPADLRGEIRRAEADLP